MSNVSFPLVNEGQAAQLVAKTATSSVLVQVRDKVSTAQSEYFPAAVEKFKALNPSTRTAVIVVGTLSVGFALKCLWNRIFCSGKKHN